MTEDVQFVCSVCGTDSKGDADNVMTQCRACERIHCKDCMDEFGQCVTCAEEKPSKT